MSELQKLPRIAWGALIVAVLGFFVSVSTHQVTTANGTVTSCTFLDYGKIAVAAIAIVLMVSSFQANSSAHVARRASRGARVGCTVVVVALAAWHLLDAFDVVTAVCPT